MIYHLVPVFPFWILPVADDLHDVRYIVCKLCANFCIISCNKTRSVFYNLSVLEPKLGRVTHTLVLISLRALFGAFKSGDPAVHRMQPNHEIGSLVLLCGLDMTEQWPTRQDKTYIKQDFFTVCLFHPWPPRSPELQSQCLPVGRTKKYTFHAIRSISTQEIKWKLKI